VRKAYKITRLVRDRGGFIRGESKIILPSRKGAFQGAATMLVHLITRNSSPRASMHSGHELNRTCAWHIQQHWTEHMLDILKQPVISTTALQATVLEVCRHEVIQRFGIQNDWGTVQLKSSEFRVEMFSDVPRCRLTPPRRTPISSVADLHRVTAWNCGVY
jgi:hypothetical protein